MHDIECMTLMLTELEGLEKGLFVVLVQDEGGWSYFFEIYGSFYVFVSAIYIFWVKKFGVFFVLLRKSVK